MSASTTSTSARYLSPAHRAELRASGLSDATIDLAGLYTEPDQVRVHEMLRWAPPKRWARSSLGDCLVFPCILPGGEQAYEMRLKPTTPRVEKKRNGKERIVKYESPKGAGVVVYFPPHTRRKAGQRGLKVFTEGEKKSLLLDQLGYTTIGLTGVANAHDVNERQQTGQWRLHPRIAEHVRVAECDCVILFDSDYESKDDVKRSTTVLGRMLMDAGATSVKLAIPPRLPNGEKAGVDDYYMALVLAGERGDAAIHDLISNARTLDVSSLDVRPRIVLGPDEHRVVDDAGALLRTVDEVYVRARRLVRVCIAEADTEHRGITRRAGSPAIELLPRPSLREIVTRYARVVTLSPEGEEKAAHPPAWLVDALDSRGRWPGLRDIAGVVESPLMRPDGSILATSGYDASTGLYVRLGPDVEGLTIRDAPTHAEAEAAALRLLDLVADFPFADDAAKAAWLACLLTLFAREAFAGPAPFFLFEAASKRTGKTLCALVTCVLATGRVPGTAGYVHDDAEMSKRITSVARSGTSLVLLDNIEGPFGLGSLDRALTTTVWRERILGTNDEPELPMRCVWMGTANNARFAATMDARTLPIRLVSPLEQPELRSGFRLPDILAYVREHRRSYVTDALTILRAYVVAGRPRAQIGTLGMYERWVELVCGAVHWATGSDPMGARARLNETGDPELENLRALVDGLLYLGTDRRTLAARDMLRALEPYEGKRASSRLDGMAEALDELVRRKPGSPITPKTLGMALSAYVDRPVKTDAGRLYRLHADSTSGTKTWGLKTVAEHAEGAARGARRGTNGTYGTGSVAGEIECAVIECTQPIRPPTERVPEVQSVPRSARAEGPHEAAEVVL